MKVHTEETQATITPEKAVQFLKEGNERFINNLKINRNLLQQVDALKDGQWPFAVILTCIDSRVATELIFDQGLGDIFVVRIAGNFVNQDILGSGHHNCGALKGSIDAEKVEDLGMDNLNHLIYHFDPIINEILQEGEERTSENKDLVERLTYTNIRHTINDIRHQSSILRKLEKQGKIKIVGANYDIKTGIVEWL